ncbi:ribonuclease T2 family protein [Porphyrobacter sp. AAP82]|uniref:ribonuclease T2 family protein n=1 Tax=Porphyrobacter sp. AAP82 TaxID=1248917 RepID=UPI0002E0C8A0|nr:ribonuclease T [Porphyrobacter sp. AAP82]
MRCSNSLLAALALAAPSLASAQAYQCRLPEVVAVPRVTPDGAPRSMAVTGYTLALSWSPEFCRTRAEDRAQAMQCGGHSGSFGLVVHGLWPEGAKGYPQWCGARKALTPAQVRSAMCMMPAERLVARAWAKHGSCMVSDPGAYLKVTRILFEGVRLPDYDRIAREEGLTAGRIRAAFVDANPEWPESAVGVHLGPRGWLGEIRLCYSKRFRPAPCTASRRGAKDGAPAKIWRGC